MFLDSFKGHMTVFLGMISPHFFTHPVLTTLMLIFHAIKIVDVHNIMSRLRKHMAIWLPTASQIQDLRSCPWLPSLTVSVHRPASSSLGSGLGVVVRSAARRSRHFRCPFCLIISSFIMAEAPSWSTLHGLDSTSSFVQLWRLSSPGTSGRMALDFARSSKVDGLDKGSGFQCHLQSFRVELTEVQEDLMGLLLRTLVLLDKPCCVLGILFCDSILLPRRQRVDWPADRRTSSGS